LRGVKKVLNYIGTALNGKEEGLSGWTPEQVFFSSFS